MRRQHAIALLNGDLAEYQFSVADCRMGLKLDLSSRDLYRSWGMVNTESAMRVQVQISQRGLKAARMRRRRAFQRWQKESRTAYVVQALDRANEARGVAIGIIGAYKRAMRTPEEQARQIEKDNMDLFGSARE